MGKYKIFFQAWGWKVHYGFLSRNYKKFFQGGYFLSFWACGWKNISNFLRWFFSFSAWGWKLVQVAPRFLKKV